MSGKIIYHGSQVIVERPEIRTGRFHKDFFFGFYCTNIKAQAIKWATRFPQTGYLSEFSYQANPELKVKVFPEMTEEWLDFIVSCRLGHPHEYDIVEGPMADDTIFAYVQNFIEGQISREAFWALAKFRHPTHQISFHTPTALQTLTFIRGYAV